ncbi:hypothetical protein B0H11DRAFT_1937028 [Mycena galericulata]|nr:hypothetical protein B0H11DRAFT_1937028 [Mycena galericulata]
MGQSKGSSTLNPSHPPHFARGPRPRRVYLPLRGTAICHRRGDQCPLTPTTIRIDFDFIGSRSSGCTDGRSKRRDGKRKRRRPARTYWARVRAGEFCGVVGGDDVDAFLIPFPDGPPAPVFSRPTPNRSRSSTITASSSGTETPPLLAIQHRHVSSEYHAVERHPSDVDYNPRPNACSRSRTGSPAPRASRSSVYGTIQEEYSSPAPSSIGSKKSSSPTACQGVYIVDGEAGSVDLNADAPGSDDERCIVALCRYYALRHDAEDLVTESRRMWSDTPFSFYALQGAPPALRPELPSTRAWSAQDALTNSALQAVEIKSNINVHHIAGGPVESAGLLLIGPVVSSRASGGARAAGVIPYRMDMRMRTRKQQDDKGGDYPAWERRRGQSLALSGSSVWGWDATTRGGFALRGSFDFSSRRGGGCATFAFSQWWIGAGLSASRRSIAEPSPFPTPSRPAHAVHARLHSWFLDAPAAPFGVHRMALAGKEVGI